MREQVRGHQTAVAVPGDADAVAVHHAELHGLVHRGLGAGHQLLHVSVVDLVGIAHHGHERVVYDCVAVQQRKRCRSRSKVRKVCVEPVTWPAILASA